MFGRVQDDRPHQGDIFQKLQYKFITEEGDIETITFPFWVILSMISKREQESIKIKTSISRPLLRVRLFFMNSSRLVLT